MKKWLFFVYGCLMALSGYTQDRYLKPVRDLGSDDDVLEKYYKAVFPLLHTGFSANPKARYTVIP